MNLSTTQYPIISLKNTVVFPYMVLPLSVGRTRSLAAAEAATNTEEKLVVLVTQKEVATEEPSQNDLYNIGTLAVIKRSIRMNENNLQLIVQGIGRVKINSVDITDNNYLLGTVEPLADLKESSTETEALHRAINDLVGKSLSMLQNVPEDLTSIVVSTEDPVKLSYMLATLFHMEIDKEQKLLEANTKLDLLKTMHEYLTHEVQVLELRQKIQGDAQAEIHKAQREYVLRQQLKQIQKELGEEDPEKAELEMLRQKIDEANLPAEVLKEVNREMKRLEKLPPAAPDHQVIRTYLDVVLELPWHKATTDNLDLKHAREVLAEDHYGLNDIKDRIIEHLAVLKLNPTAKSPIICFVGPPGVGKTSLGHSIARALGRKFERMSLGGVHDEAELRGHRRTYIGSMPGRIIQSMRRAGVKNPVLMLDEVDKLGRDFRGDPASALLEVLDPAQNTTFRDHYLDLPFDLSKVFFICTANSLETIPGPLLDRMEVISLSGYTEQEKLEISKRYLLPRQLKETGLTDAQIQIDEKTISELISSYTREAGVRQLERTLGQLARKVAVKIALSEVAEMKIEPSMLDDLLGPDKFLPEEMRTELQPGVATGLAWTPVGGDVLYIEATLLPGGKDLTLTGQLGDVMKESARAAMSYLWANSHRFGIDREVFKNAGLHLHVPAGAVPKDGPSAGITMTTALASLYLNKAMRADTAMTGEITLSGLVLPIGGLKEKVLAARRAGIRRIIMPKANEKDLVKLPVEVKQEMEFIPVKTIEQVLNNAIEGFDASAYVIPSIVASAA
ncbi:MAG: endopeptidase La [Acidobacteria bacterium]|nr:endopeptidase La [Acidobacteriota bacterium]